MLKRFLGCMLYAAVCCGSEPVRTDVWRAGEGDYKIFRIPGIVVTSRGSVLAYSEAPQE